MLALPIFTVAVITIAKMYKQPKCPAMKEWMKRTWNWNTYYSVFKKRRNSVIYNNMDELEDNKPWGHDAKWRKTSISWFHLHVVPKIAEFIESKSRIVDSRGWERGKRGPMGIKFQLTCVCPRSLLDNIVCIINTLYVYVLYESRSHVKCSHHNNDNQKSC